MSLCSFSSDSHSGSFLVIDNAFINEYLPVAPEYCVKVYLYGLYLCSTPNSVENTLNNLTHVLNMTASDVKDAFEYWQGEGLVQLIENTSTNEISIKYLPVHKRIGSAKKFANKYADFNKKIQAIIKSRMITPSEFNEYYTLLESFHIEEEALLNIVTYCVSLKGENVGYPYIITVAKNFANEGLLTTEAVKEKLEMHQEVNSEVVSVLKIFKPSTKQSNLEDRSLYVKWTTEFGFNLGTIKEVAKQIKPKNGNMQKLDNALFSYFKSNLLSIQEIAEYNANHEFYLNLAKEITRLIGVYYENLDMVIETYILDWLKRGYDDDTLKTIATYCFKHSTKTLEGMNNTIQKFYKLGLVTKLAINQYIENIVSCDAKIQEILEVCNILRSVNSFDRETYNTWTTKWNLNEEIILCVANYSKDKNQPIQYMNKILANIYEQKLSSIDEVSNYLNNFAKTNKSNKNQVANFEQREYNQADLDALFDDLDNIKI